MKKIIGLMLLASAAVMSAHACDVCGCSASNQYLGILPKANLNFIGFQYQYNTFTSSHPSLFENKPDEHGKDYYNTFQLWGRYNLGRRLQLFAFVPYRYNTQYLDGVKTTNAGLGDVSVLANAVLIPEDPGREKGWQQQWLAGGGLKLPTGAYTGITDMDKQGLPNMQPGTGSWDFVVNTNYTLRHRAVGLNVDAAYTITTPNSEHYKYGNRVNAGLLGFYAIKGAGITLLPQAGIRYEYTLHDYDNYDRKWLNEQSGGYFCFATAGLQAYYRQFGARLTYQLPLSQQYATGYVTVRQKLDAGIFFLF